MPYKGGGVIPQTQDRDAICKPLHTALAMLSNHFDVTAIDCPFCHAKDTFTRDNQSIIGRLLVQAMEYLGQAGRAGELRGALLGLLQRVSQDNTSSGIFALEVYASPAA
jgi:hypothetical protein